ncbi:MAG: VCBS repeat-containing protein [Candidatus Omnitrophica bacterium]|nr:VCBS repeat-containing protein [Candidatus Omnitrophota bacterium]
MTDAMKQLSPQGDWIPFLRRLVEKTDADADFLFLLAQASWRAGDVDAAIEMSEKAMQASPNDLDLLYKCAAIARTSGRIEEAKKRIRRILDLDENHSDGLFLLGGILAEEGDNDSAKTILTKVIQIQPTHFRSLFELGKLETRLGNYEAAVHHLQAAAAVYPFFREAYSAMRTPLARLGKEDELKRVQLMLDKTRRWNPNKYARLRHSFQNAYDISPALSAELAMELTSVEREDLAKIYLENLHRQKKTDDNLKLLLAQLRFNADEFKDCLSLLETIAGPDIQNTDTYIGLKTWTLLRLNRIGESVSLFNQYEQQFAESPHFQALAKILPKIAPFEKEDEPQNRFHIRFVDCTEEAGLHVFRHTLGNHDKRWIVDAMGSGVAVADYDNDGDDDIYFVNGRPDINLPDPAWRNALFRNDGGVFTDVTQQAGVGDLGYGMCAIFGDVDNDGWLDLFVGNYGANALYRNNGNGSFTEFTKESGLENDDYAAAAAFGDVDRDGDLDLFVGNYVEFDPEMHGALRANYHGKVVMAGPMGFKYQPDLIYFNDGSGHFVEKSDQAKINISEGRAMGAAFLDFDNDNDLDLYVANDSTYNHVLKNNGGFFEDVSFLSGAAVCENGRDGASMGVAVGDVNNDGFLDIFVTSYEQESDVIFQNNGNAQFTDMTGPWGLIGPTRWLTTWGTGLCDFDSDGFLDYFTVNGHTYPQIDELDFGRNYHQGLSIYKNQGAHFDIVTDSAISSSLKKIAGRGTALLDYDQDGDMDVVINCIDDSPRLLENRSIQGNWLQVKLEGFSAQTFGVCVVARKGDEKWTRIVDGGSGYLSQNSQTLHFGFGNADQIDELKIYWMHRDAQEIASPALNQKITIPFNNKPF